MVWKTDLICVNIKFSRATGNPSKVQRAKQGACSAMSAFGHGDGRTHDTTAPILTNLTRVVAESVGVCLILCGL